MKRNEEELVHFLSDPGERHFSVPNKPLLYPTGGHTLRQYSCLVSFITWPILRITGPKFAQNKYMWVYAFAKYLHYYAVQQPFYCSLYIELLFRPLARGRFRPFSCFMLCSCANYDNYIILFVQVQRFNFFFPPSQMMEMPSKYRDIAILQQIITKVFHNSAHFPTN